VIGDLAWGIAEELSIILNGTAMIHEMTMAASI
jgi:hypothetical protein